MNDHQLLVVAAAILAAADRALGKPVKPEELVRDADSILRAAESYDRAKTAAEQRDLSERRLSGWRLAEQ
jgi:hypothetical protein